MNLLLLRPEDFLPDGTVRLTGRRLAHAREVLRLEPGDKLRVGLLRGLCGEGQVLAILPHELRMKVALVEAPPPRPGLDLLLAIPRPKALKKVLPACASLGVDRIVLLNAARVEKSYFDSKVLDPTFIEGLLLEGLEQAKDTVVPQVLLRERFRPFVEDELESFAGPHGQRLLPHPQAAQGLEGMGLTAPRTLLAVGPDGGWVPFEVELLEAHGFQPFTLGPRTLRVEVAIPYLLGALRT